MAVLQFQRMHPGWAFWFKWMVANIAGAVLFVAGMIPLNLLMSLVVPMGQTPTPPTQSEQITFMLYMAVSTGMMGAALGVTQWWVLRGVLHGIGWWIPATILGYVLASGAQFVVPCEFDPAVCGSGMLGAMGLAVGVCQWFVLRKHVRPKGASNTPTPLGNVRWAALPPVRRAVWWIVITLVGWLLAFVLTGLAFMTGLYVEPFDMVAVLLVPSAVTGAGLMWLKHIQERPDTSSRNTHDQVIPRF